MFEVEGKNRLSKSVIYQLLDEPLLTAQVCLFETHSTVESDLSLKHIIFYKNVTPKSLTTETVGSWVARKSVYRCSPTCGGID